MYTNEEINRYAIVTGVSSGVGEAMALSLLEKGFTVFGASRSGSEIEHESYIDIECDLRHEDAVENFFRVVEEETEEIDILVNNAGICLKNDLGETSASDFQNQIETNLMGTFYFLKHFESFIVEDESHVITILSNIVNQSFSGMSAYAASKHGIVGLIDSCKIEWEKYNVKFTSLYPGAIDTPLWEVLDPSFPKDKMLTTEEFIHVFDMVLTSSHNIQFPEIHFKNRSRA
jgi:NAD(P)-dependent dehydrogenase (short-subunit alcohol dehydrogenase family)